MICKHPKGAKEPGFPGALASFLSTDDLAGLASEERVYGNTCLWICSCLKRLYQRKSEKGLQKSGPRKGKTVKGLNLQVMGMKGCIILENLF